MCSIIRRRRLHLNGNKVALFEPHQIHLAYESWRSYTRLFTSLLVSFNEYPVNSNKKHTPHPKLPSVTLAFYIPNKNHMSFEANVIEWHEM